MQEKKISTGADDTIVAPATRPGSGALTILRMSGPACFSIADRVVRLKNGTVAETAGGRVRFGSVQDGDELLDEVLVSVFRAPHSYTGEDSVEISCHASPYVSARLTELLCDAGARMAEPGEFTRRAFLAGKMDLSQAEAVADVIAARSQASLRVAMNHLKGGFSKDLGVLREQLLQLTALMELELDFSEEEVEFADREQLNALLEDTTRHVDQLRSSFRLGNAIKNGVPVVIAGSTNAGKSTLLNALLGEDRAIVSDIEGTTRDTIEELFNLDGILFRFIDTAGIRGTEEVIERIGIERTWRALSEADIVLGMLDLTRSVKDNMDSAREILAHCDPARQHVVFLLNKQDIWEEFGGSLIVNKNVILHNEIVSLTDNKADIIEVSAKTGFGLEKLKTVLVHAEKVRIEDGSEVLVTNARHLEALSRTHECLLRVRTALDEKVPTDLVVEDLREALRHIGSIVGVISSDEVLGEIFGKFCIGK